ncbi:MAG: DNA polymerase III subunit delta' [Magnetovibrionaceae bacterium]
MDDEIPHPREIAHLVGQDQAEAELARAFSSGRCPHAWLLTGPKGIGKATLAYRFARHVLKAGTAETAELDAGAGLFGDDLPAVAPADLSLNPEDPVFRRVATGSHADLFVVERAFDEKRGRYRSEIVIDDVRGIGSFFGMTSGEGGWRVVIVDSADEMNRNAANALLKVLEEPPERCLLLLVSHNPGRLLPTIRSRCRQLACKPLDDQVLSAEIARALPDLPEADVTRLARLADGSLGRARALSGEGGLELFDNLMNLLASLPRLDATSLQSLTDKLARTGQEAAFQTLTELLAGFLNRLIIATSGGGTRATDGREAELINRLAPEANLERWLTVWENSRHLFERTTAVNLDRKQVLLTVFLEVEAAARGS